MVFRVFGLGYVQKSDSGSILNGPEGSRVHPATRCLVEEYAGFDI